MYHTPSYYIYVPCVVGVTATLLLMLAYLRYRRNRRRAKVYETTGTARQQKQRTIAEWELQVGLEQEQEMVQQADTSVGDQIWFSRYIYARELKQMAILVQGMRYQIRRDQKGDDFIYERGPWTLEQEEERANLAEILAPGIDGYHLCLIGWTTVPQSNVMSFFEQTQQEYGRFCLPEGRYHKFMQLFASRIVSKPAIDRTWFNNNTRTNISKGKKMPRATPAMISARIASQTRMRFRQPESGDCDPSLLMSNLELNQQLLHQTIPPTRTHMELPPYVENPDRHWPQDSHTDAAAPPSTEPGMSASADRGHHSTSTRCYS